LDLRCPNDNQEWFWGPLRASGKHDLVYTGYATMPHTFLMTLCERWHAETSNFHLHVGRWPLLWMMSHVWCIFRLKGECWAIQRRCCCFWISKLLYLDFQILLSTEVVTRLSHDQVALFKTFRGTTQSCAR
jgi:hypothetical protein